MAALTHLHDSGRELDNRGEEDGDVRRPVCVPSGPG
jgi:hypothetical protein